MDNDSIFYDAKRFDAVWKRVSESAGSSAAGDDEVMLKFIEDEYGDMELYRYLAINTRGNARGVFAAAAEDEARHFRTLRTRYYILTGKAVSPGHSAAMPPAGFSLSAVLRERYEAESAGAAAYLGAAEKAKKRDIAEMYRRFSADETRHSRQIWFLLSKIIG